MYIYIYKVIYLCNKYCVGDGMIKNKSTDNVLTI